MSKATLLFVSLFWTSAFLGCGPSSPESSVSVYPEKTVTVICPWAPGGGTDRLSRYVADRLQASYQGTPFVVQNKTGGSGAVGHSAGALARPDGHTILMATFELSTMHWMGVAELDWQDYRWVAQLNADAAAIMVREDSPWQSLSDLLDAIKEKPGEITMSGTATGGAWDLARAGMMLAAKIPVDAAVWVPAKGSAPAIVELLGGHVDVVCCSVPEAAAQIESGQLRTLAVMSDSRLDAYPDLPTCGEQGVEWSAFGWRGLALPRDTPESVVTDLLQKIEVIVKSEDYLEFMQKNGFDATFRGPSEFANFLKTQDAQWESVIKAAGYGR